MEYELRWWGLLRYQQPQCYDELDESLPDSLLQSLLVASLVNNHASASYIYRISKNAPRRTTLRAINVLIEECRRDIGMRVGEYRWECGCKKWHWNRLKALIILFQWKPREAASLLTHRFFFSWIFLWLGSVFFVTCIAGSKLLK